MPVSGDTHQRFQSPSRKAAYTIRSPPGDQPNGQLSLRAAVTSRGEPPEAGTTAMLVASLFFNSNASVRPSGDHTGNRSGHSPLVTACAVGSANRRTNRRGRPVSVTIREYAADDPS